MTARRSPTVRRRRLAIELRRLRTAAGLSLEDAARQIERTAATVSRIENAQVGIRAREVATLLDLYGVTDPPMRDALLTIAREARQKGWWRAYGDVLPEWFQVYVGLESAASSLWIYQVQVVPGLLQTEDYARALLGTGAGAASGSAEVERQVALRMTRQEILSGDAPTKLWTVLDEGVLRRLVGCPEVMRGQLERLAEESTKPNVTIQVLPFSAGADTGVPGSFSLLSFPESPPDPPIVYLEHLGGSLYLDKAEAADRYGGAVGHLQAAALSPRGSVELITAMATGTHEPPAGRDTQDAGTDDA